MPTITKEAFCEAIETLRQQYCLDKKHGEYIQEMFQVPARCSYNDNALYKLILDLLRIHFPKDADGFCLIEHYCFFIEFGKSDGKELITPEDLYDQLLANQQLP